MSTYAPRRCGIASYTYDLASTLGEREIVALHQAGEACSYPTEVRNRIRRDVHADYLGTARILNEARVDVISIQHETGIWGGEDGSYVLDFVRALRKPVVATLHSFPGAPTDGQRRILSELVDTAAATVVMSRSAASVLAAQYGVAEFRLEVVPHGVPDLPIVDPDTIKPRLGLEGRSVILSFGLLRPGKGYEGVIDALPAIAAAAPSVLYAIVGATHPDALALNGEAYRLGLAARAADLGVSDHVRFVDQYVARSALGTWLQAADVFVTPFEDLDRVGSGSLSYAMGAGKAIVSTPYAYASEVLGPGDGRLVGPAGWPEAILELLADPGLRATLGRRAHAATRDMVWSAVAGRYRAIFARVSAGDPPTRGARQAATLGV